MEIKIFVAKDEHAASGPRPLLRGAETAGVTEVKESSRRRRYAPTVLSRLLQSR